MKKFITKCLTVFCVLASLSTNVFAGNVNLHSTDANSIETSANTSSEAVLAEKSPQERITSSGTFEFDTSSILTSDVFTVTSTTAKITAKATTSGTGKKYKITFYSKSGLVKYGAASYTADGSNYEYTFTGLTNGGEYYFTIIPESGTGKVSGSGSISNFGKVK